jgi:hypothetical protein
LDTIFGSKTTIIFLPVIRPALEWVVPSMIAALADR